MKVLDLFSGIGGFSLGLEEVGFETVAFCEIEEFPRAVIRRHWPDTPIYNDVRTLTAKQLRADGVVRPDVIVGGYPCQPFSVAGQRRGAEDDRHLWPEVYRLVTEIRPTWGIFENVAGHIRMGLDQVLSDLEGAGYAARPFVIPACGVDAPHKRDRVWVVAHSNSQGQPDGSVNEKWLERAADVGDAAGSELGWDDGRRPGEHQQSASIGLERSSEDVADTNNGQRDRERQKVFARRDTTHIGGKTLADPSNQRLQGRTEEHTYGVGDISQKSERSGKNEPDLWPTEPDVGRVVNGVSDFLDSSGEVSSRAPEKGEKNGRAERIKALGNAVVPQIPRIIGKTIMKFEGQGGL